MADDQARRNAQLYVMAKRPDLARAFVRTGKLPDVVSPESPLIDLLESIEAPDRGMIWNVTLNPALGYQCTRAFPTAKALYEFLKPAEYMYGVWEAERLRIKEYTRAIRLEDLLLHSQRYPRLIRVQGVEVQARKQGDRVDVALRHNYFTKKPPEWMVGAMAQNGAVQTQIPDPAIDEKTRT